MKNDPIEEALNRLGTLKHEDGMHPAALVRELKTFLKNRSNLVVAKAVKLTGQRRIPELMPDLISVFHRLMENPGKLDKGCTATTEIAGALYEMDHVEPEIYLLGIHHVQMEGSFGPPVDAAAKLRAICALGLARTRHPAALDEIVSLLVDSWPQARIGAVRAMASNGGQAGSLLLKLKILHGEDDPEVLAECFSGLLASLPERSVSFIAGFIASDDIAVAEAAVLALGSSRLPEALEVLKSNWSRTAGGPLRKILLVAIATVRSEDAIEFLLSLLQKSPIQAAKDVLTALAIFRDNDTIRTRVERVASSRNDKALSEAFRKEF